MRNQHKMTTIKQEHTPTDKEVVDMARFLGNVFGNDPLALRMFGSPYVDNPDIRHAVYESDLRKALAAGRIHAIRSDDAGKELLAISVSFSPGYDDTDVPTLKRAQALVDALSDEQKAFRREFIAKQNADNEATYPHGFERANLYIQLMGVRSDSRRNGLGSALIKHILDEAKSEGVQLMLDTSVHDNIRFYENCGLRLYSHFEISHYQYGPLPKMYTFATGI